MTRKVEKIIRRPIVSSKVERIKLDKAQSVINDKIHNNEKDYDEIVLTTSEQWERVNVLLLLITTILIFNATALIVAFFSNHLES